MKTQKEIQNQLDSVQNFIDKVASSKLKQDLMAWEEALLWVLQ